jgi:hypothetical protein
MKYNEMYKMASDRLKSELFDLEGFKESKGGLGGGIGFFKKIGDLRILRMGCSILKYGDFQKLNGFGGSINFLEIENIITPILGKFELMGKGNPVDRITIEVHFECMGFAELKIRPSYNAIQIHNEVDVNYVVEAMKTNYLTYTKIGFEKFTSIEQFLPLIEGKDFKQLLPILGQFSYFKKAIILSLQICRNIRHTLTKL